MCKQHRPLLKNKMIIGDNELISLYLDNEDIDALNELVTRHSRMVYGVCRKMLWRAEDAEDAFQIVFMLLCKKAPRLLKHNSLGGWLQKTSVLTCLKLRRRIQRTREVNMGQKPIDVADKSAKEPWQTITNASDVETLHQEIRRLPTMYREVIVLCHLEGKSRAQAAALLDCTTASVKAALARGRKQLRQRLLKHGISATVALEASQQVEAVDGKSPSAELVANAELAANEDAVFHSLQPLIAATLLKCQGLNSTVAVGSGSGIVNAFIQKEFPAMSFLFNKTCLVVACTSILLGTFCLAALAANPNQEPDPQLSIATVLQNYSNDQPVSFRTVDAGAASQQEEKTDKVDPAAKTEAETWDEYTIRLHDINIINETQLAKWRDGNSVTVAGSKIPYSVIRRETRTRTVPVTTMTTVDNGNGTTRIVPEIKNVEKMYVVSVPHTKMVNTELVIPVRFSKPDDAINPGFQPVASEIETPPYRPSIQSRLRMAQAKPSQVDAKFDEVDPETVQIRGWTSPKGESCVVAEDLNGKLLRLFVDINDDTKTDRMMYYLDGELSFVDKDTNGDGRMDRVEQFMPDKVRVGVDTDLDGEIDEWSEEERAKFDKMYSKPEARGSN